MGIRKPVSSENFHQPALFAHSKQLILPAIKEPVLMGGETRSRGLTQARGSGTVSTVAVTVEPDTISPIAAGAGFAGGSAAASPSGFPGG
jgi:hypothetical protein